MDEYLQYMKTLRSQMNDVEDQAAKISVEEQMHYTTIQSLEKDILSAKSVTKRRKEETEQMIKEKAHICSQILEKQRKIASLELDSSTLSQNLELTQQEIITLSAKLTAKRTCYSNAAEDLNAKLQEQQEWINSQGLNPETGEHEVVKDEIREQYGKAEGDSSSECHLNVEGLDNEAIKDLMSNLSSARAKLDEIMQMKEKIDRENGKGIQSIEEARHRINDFKPELNTMDLSSLEEEHKALLSDKAKETEYLLSLQCQIAKLKGISHVIECACGGEYEVEMDTCV